MKILYIAPDITDSGGISRVISLKTNYFVCSFNYKVVILSVNDCTSNRFYDFHSDIKWFNIKKTKNLFFFRNYIRLIKEIISKEKPDVIVICDAVLWLFIPWFLQTKIPIIFETHFSVSFEKVKNRSLYTKLRSGLVHFFKQKTINKFSCFVSVTDEGSKEWNAKNKIVIPNPVSFKVAEKANLVNKRAMAVCMIPHIKGLDRLLLIWSRITQTHPDWQLDIYGQLAADSEYQEMANKLNISNNINFLSPVKDIQHSYNQSSVFLMTSRTEAFGMVLIEAMASGVPCIAYDCPSGPRVIIDDEVNGFLIEDGNSDLFVQKLELLIEDENLRFQMGKAAQESIKKYEIEGIMKKWDKLFLDLI
ncbi:glycosyltransferase family 4 protein [Flavobacterium aquicola]|uniref:Glycosyltransferase involved in cell wall biosynthesis n=1 Tax=Flavobacterium aquicola TaxID=1682742 RepID=A0A3E0EL63_9FLAO|nr:glycosyltransferase family 4 protein [Flavobacterium aquicola]REG98463.1 glycosyltransferase involved in cell wall biosynthesis [Flavobacterium aquicola]